MDWNKTKKPQAVLGLDVGTSGAKAVVCARDGTVLGKGYREYSLHFGNAGEVEQTAADWYLAAAEATRDAVRAAGDNCPEIVGISLSTQGGSMLALDRDGNDLSPVMTWMDGRAGAEAEALCRKLGRETLYRVSGWNPGAAYDIAKILWLRNHRPDIFGKTACFATTLEYMNQLLTGQMVSDPTNAAIRILYDIRKCRYDPEILGELGIREEQLPKILPTGTPVGTLTGKAAKDFGLKSGIPVYNGAHDQYCASLGAGAVEPGDLMVATGTAWVVLGITDRPLFSESHVSPGVHPVRGLYGAMASLVSAGSALKWYRNLVGEDYASLDRGAETHRDSAAGLFFAPYLAGAGFPHRNPEEPSRLIGLKLSHDRYDLARALMEGVAFEARRVIEEMETIGCPVSRLYMAGRTAHSSLWRGLVRDICNREILVTEEPDTCCIGAAAIAAAGAGLYDTLGDAVRGMAKLSLRDLPDDNNVTFYENKYRRYRELTGDGREGKEKSL